MQGRYLLSVEAIVALATSSHMDAIAIYHRRHTFLIGKNPSNCPYLPGSCPRDAIGRLVGGRRGVVALRHGPDCPAACHGERSPGNAVAAPRLFRACSAS